MDGLSVPGVLVCGQGSAHYQNGGYSGYTGRFPPWPGLQFGWILEHQLEVTNPMDRGSKGLLGMLVDDTDNRTHNWSENSWKCCWRGLATQVCLSAGSPVF